MKIDRKDFLEALDLITPAIGDKDIEPKHIRYYFSSDRISAYSGEFGATISFETGINCGVEASSLYSMLSVIDKKTLDISCNGKLVIKSGKFFTDFRVFPVSEEPEYLQILKKEKPKWAKIPDKLIEAISLSLYAASNDISYSERMGVYCDKESVWASDGCRASVYSLDSDTKKAFFLPVNAASVVKKYSFTHYFVSSSWIHFKDKNSGLMFGCLLSAQEFPIEKLKENFPPSPRKKKEKLEVDLQKFKNVCKASLLIFPDEFDSQKVIDLSVSDKKLFLSGKSSVRVFKDVIPLKKEVKEDMEFRMNAVFLVEALDRAADIFLYPNEKFLLIKFGGLQHGIGFEKNAVSESE